MKIRKKPVIVDTDGRWFQMGDNPDVKRFIDFIVAEDREKICDKCEHPLFEHGQIKTLEGHHIVCPGDWIIIGVKGEKYPCKPDIFAMTYEIITEGGGIN